MLEINENIYGHKNRLTWIKKHISKDMEGLEFGCGTGVMITGILLQEGYNIKGIDLDEESIALGKSIFKKNNLDEQALICGDLKKLPNEKFDYIVASEVLEHIPDEYLNDIFIYLNKKLKKDGVLLVTIPNGYGWFEFEDFLWKTMHIHALFRFFKLYFFIEKFKKYLIGYHYLDCKFPSSIADSPHVQRFTINNIIKKTRKYHFVDIDKQGSVLFAGPFSNIFFTGFKSIMNMNILLGKKFPRISSGFYIAFKKVN